ncbi:LysE/ArgO family amino acid transporter [Arthrobacter agilis]|uniref:LysE/ArgO family amino acid transporter n=1 Tax=Arthrobacter agilis TaxID=37921 RepID=UPI00277F6C14|nr:LysE/ArgO family amino acid transporter [Arthrobacter agilis]MDQ0736125.1 L-lysine exporter family protein LysE/ArgO [Arthrobacter agilis]
MIATAAVGFATGLTLIVAIGSQNAFVLRQGLRRSHVMLVVAVCASSDLVLIVLGVSGLGAVIERAPGVLEVVRWAGAAFLAGYGILAARRALQGEHLDADGGSTTMSWRAALGTCLALTWLNPHVYLDTVLLLGSLATMHGTPGKWWFAAGAALGSLVWFSALGVGARFLAPLFARPSAWRVLDALIAVVMLGLAVMLVLR